MQAYATVKLDLADSSPDILLINLIKITIMIKTTIRK